MGVIGEQQVTTAQGLPAIAPIGSYLIKSGTDNYATSFVGLGGAALTAATWYDNRIRATKPVATALAQNFTYYLPVYFPTITNIMYQLLNITTLSNATCTLRTGFYTTGGNGKPDMLINGSVFVDAGTGGSTGMKLFDRTGLTVPTGWVWYAVGTTGTGTAPTLSTTGQENVPAISSPSQSTGTLFTAFVDNLTAASGGTLPSTAPSTLVVNAVNYLPMCWYRTT